jgi:hypothetical protein
VGHDGDQFIMQFAGSVQGKFYADEVTLESQSALEQEGKWRTEGSEFHFAGDDYEELSDILGKPAPEIVQQGNEWGHVASKTAANKTAAMDATLHARLLMAVTEYDRKQQGKSGYNHYALPQYLGAVQRAIEMIDSGESVRNSLITCFSGRLLSTVLKAAGEPKGTKEEIQYGRTSAKTAEHADWNTGAPNPNFPGETTLSCPKCGSTDVTMTGSNLGSDVVRGNNYSMNVCKSCGHRDSWAEPAPTGYGWGAQTGETKTADNSNPNNTDGFTETTFDPYGAFSAQPGDCPTCFGEGAYSDLNPDGKGFGPEQDCADCGGTGKTSAKTSAEGWCQCGHKRSDHYGSYTTQGRGTTETSCKGNGCGCQSFRADHDLPVEPRSLSEIFPPVGMDTSEYKKS